MSTTIIATIVISVLATLMLISLGFFAWVIVSLKRRFSGLENLCSVYKENIDNIYREFENVNRNHDEIIKNVDQKIGDIYKDIENDFKDVDRRITEAYGGIEKQLDKRFDNAYRKMLKGSTKD